MKAYTIEGSSPTLGIKLVNGKVSVGEDGRGRHQAIIPVPEGSIINDGVLVEAPSPNADAVVLYVRDYSGYRGTWKMTRGVGVKVIANGVVAQGQAGNMGGGPEYLLSLRPGGSFRIERDGRLYGSPSVYEVRNTDGIVTVIDIDAEMEAANASKEW